MGKHSPAIDGTVTANGHALEPFTTRSLQQLGPVSLLPRPDDPGQSRTALHDPGRWRHAVSAHRGWLAAVPIVLVNTVATGAQLGFWRVHLTAAQAVFVALALESIAIYLAWMSHLAQLADDSALRLRLAAYGMALLIGTLNYSHFMLPGWRPTVAAVTFGLMSAISPWLWSVHSRRVSRDALQAMDRLEPHAVRLGMTRWTWHPVLSYRVMRLATWEGENRPKAAIALLSSVTSDDAVDDGDGDGDDGVRPPSPDPSSIPSPSKNRQGKPSAKAARARAVMKRNPDLNDAQVAAKAGVSESTARRARADMNGAAT